MHPTDGPCYNTFNSASLWPAPPMQAHRPKPMPRRWDVLQHVQQRQPVACAAHAGLLPHADAIHAHASPPMGRAARCAPAVPGARELPKLCAYLVLLAGLVNSPRDARKQWHELQLFGIF